MSWDDEPIKGIVIDNGTGMCKAGFSGEDAPRFIFPAVVGRPIRKANAQSAETKDCYIGEEVQKRREMLAMKYPMSHGIITDWDDMEKVWDYTFHKLINGYPDEYQVLLTETAYNPKMNKEKMAQVMFETFRAEAFYLTTQGILSLYAAGRHSGIMINLGDGVTDMTPFYESYRFNDAVRRLDIAGRDLTHYLAELLEDKGYSFATSAEMEIARDMKEKLCYVALDYDEEVNLSKTQTVEDFYELPDGTKITIENERFKCPEVLFQPELLGMKEKGIHEKIYESLQMCDIDTRSDIYCNIFISGGTSMFRGFQERLSKELKKLLPSSRRVNVIAREERKYSVWIGGSILSSLSAYQDMVLTRQDYEEFGPTIVTKRCF